MPLMTEDLADYLRRNIKCSKCGAHLRSIGVGEDEYGVHEAFVCDACDAKLKDEANAAAAG